MTYSEFYKENRGRYCTLNDWRNKHGERFKLIQMRDAAFHLYITGDETDWEMVPLFNPQFGIYTKEELAEIGTGLIESKLGNQNANTLQSKLSDL